MSMLADSAPDTASLAHLTLRTLRAGLATFDADGRLVEVDERGCELLSLRSPDDLGDRLDHPRWAAVHLDMTPVDLVSDPVRIAIGDTSTSIADVLGVLTSDGDTRWLAVTAVAHATSDGSCSGCIASLVEVTGIVRDRAAVDHAERLGRSVFDHTATPMCLVADGGRITDWNRSFADRLDRPDHELIHTAVDRWITGARDVVERTFRQESVGPVLTRWFDGTDVVVRCWPTTMSGVRRWMLELAPPPCG